MKILFAELIFWKNHQELKRAYSTKVTAAFKEVRKLLPQVPRTVNFVVQPAAYESMPECGTGGWIKNSELVMLFFDPSLPYGKEALLKSTRETVFHELNHAARYAIPLWHKSFVDNCIFEGIATVFERERAGAKLLYGMYTKAEAARWLAEVKKKAVTLNWRDYMFTHPDGRKWVGYKVGCYLIDEALAKSGKTVEDLTRLECREIVKLAELE